jgi:tRNA nucleotidyltransferase/poly(A) polymerase
MDLETLEKEVYKDPVLLKVSDLVKREKIPFYLVGGYLRDLSLAKERKDYDFTLPEEASSFIPLMERTFQFHFFRVGKDPRISSFRVTGDDLSMDVTFFQGQTIEEDLRRRDFTINTLAFSFLNRTWHWAEGALDDIRNRRICPVSEHSLDQDPLRMLRAIRYACTLDHFHMDQRLKQEISAKRGLILEIPGERVKMELDHVLLSPHPHAGIKILHESGLLVTLFPELKGLENLAQNEYHHLHVLSHTLLAIEKIPCAIDWIRAKGGNLPLAQEDLLCLYYAVLFHDIGKQEAYSNDERERVHFYHHETYSCRNAERIMERLRFPNEMERKVVRLIENHMRILNLSSETKETALKRLVHQTGDETPLLIIHSLADKEASRGIFSYENDQVVEGHCLHLLELYRQKEIVHPLPLISGHDVMALGYSPGPRVGQILTVILHKQVVGEIKTREEALRVLREEFGLE